MALDSSLDAVIFDLDGTLTRVPSPWRYVHQRLGLWDGVASAFLEEWLAGAISYEDFCRRDLDLWRGRRLEEIEAILDEIEINRHVGEIVMRLEADQVPSIIISSGFSYLARQIQTRFEWERLRICANELVEGPEVRIQVSADEDSPRSKGRHAESALRSSGADPKRTLVVSDAERDLQMMSQCRYRLLIEDEGDLLKIHGVLDGDHE